MTTRCAYDGVWLACAEVKHPGPDDDPKWPRSRAALRRLDRQGDHIEMQTFAAGPILGATTFVWAADGSAVLVAHVTPSNPSGAGGAPAVTRRIFDLKTKTSTPVEVPAGHFVCDWSRDGKTLLTCSDYLAGKDAKPRLALVPRAGGTPECITPEDTQATRLARLSPDGTKVLFVAPDPEAQGPEPARHLYVVGVKGGKPARVSEVLNGTVCGACWSPDGQRIAYAWRQTVEKPDEVMECESFLLVCDTDSKNEQTIATEKMTGFRAARIPVLTVLDWR